MSAQLPVALSQGALSGGQQSDIASETDISPEAGIAMEADISIDFAAAGAATPTIGSIATDVAIRTANRVLATFMIRLRAPLSGGPPTWSSDVFAILVRK
jgi:hypothetical protein